MPEDEEHTPHDALSWDLTSTQETLTQRVALTRIYGQGSELIKTIIGWEYAAPKPGERYTIYLGKGKYLRTSPVQQVINSPNTLMIKTANSLYELKYVD
jgi:hypothetical protein